MADMRGPYTPRFGRETVPFPAQYKWISRVLSVTVALYCLIMCLPTPPASSAILKSVKTLFPCWRYTFLQRISIKFQLCVKYQTLKCYICFAQHKSEHKVGYRHEVKVHTKTTNNSLGYMHQIYASPWFCSSDQLQT